MLSKKPRICDIEVINKIKKCPCAICGYGKGCDAHHIKTRGAFGDDVEHNLLPLCRSCHIRVHAKGLLGFIEKHPSLRLYLRLINRDDLIDRALGEK